MTVQSIWTAVQIGDVTGNHLFLTPRQMPLGEVNGVGEFDHLSQEVWTRAKALDDAGNLVPSGTGPPEIIGSARLARCVGVFGDFDLCSGHWR